MEHYKSVELLPIFKMSSPPPQKRKTPYWKLSRDLSGLNIMQRYISCKAWKD